jgi:hypothetical protein
MVPGAILKYTICYNLFELLLFDTIKNIQFLDTSRTSTQICLLLLSYKREIKALQLEKKNI